MDLKLVDQTGKADIFALSGHMGLDAVQKIESKFKSEIGRARKSVILDISGVTFVSSYGIRLLLDALQTLEKNGRKLLLVNPQPSIRDVLIGCEMDTLAGIYDTVDQAINAV